MTSSRHEYLDLTPAERQEVLRRLKRGPALPRERTAEYACQVRLDVLRKREPREQGKREKVQK
jgi:hypothetical protein